MDGKPGERDELARLREERSKYRDQFPWEDARYIESGPLPPTTCIRCGSLVGNVDLHDLWHEKQALLGRSPETSE